MLVRLPGGKLIVVDAKVPLDAYLSAIEAATDEERGVHLARHARQTRDHIVKLASKGYQSQLESSPELVVMFVPSEGIYHAALSEDPSLIEYGVEQQVLLATPTTLIGLLRAIHYGWKQEQIAASAREIAETARELHKRIARFIEPFARVGRQLGSAVSAYNEAVGSFESRVMPQLRRIEEAGAGSGRDDRARRRRGGARASRGGARARARADDAPSERQRRARRRHDRRHGHPQRAQRQLSGRDRHATSRRRQRARQSARDGGPSPRSGYRTLLDRSGSRSQRARPAAPGRAPGSVPREPAARRALGLRQRAVLTAVPLIESLNPRMPSPSERPISGSRLAPKTSSTTSSSRRM